MCRAFQIVFHHPLSTASRDCTGNKDRSPPTVSSFQDWVLNHCSKFLDPLLLPVLGIQPLPPQSTSLRYATELLGNSTFPSPPFPTRANTIPGKLQLQPLWHKSGSTSWWKSPSVWFGSADNSTPRFGSLEAPKGQNGDFLPTQFPKSFSWQHERVLLSRQ